MSFEIALEELREDLDDTIGEEEASDDLSEPVVVEDPSGKLEELIALESLLSERGLVDQNFAGQLVDYMPSTVSVNSYTKHPTKVNYGITQEFIGSAIKMVATVGIVAALGVLGVIAYRMVKRRKALPKVDLSRKVIGAFASIESKFEGLVSSLQSKFSQVNHPQINWKRSEAASRSASSNNARVIECKIASGDYPFISPKLISTAIDQGQRTIDFISKEIMPAVRDLTRMGSGDDIDELSAKVDGFNVGDGLVSNLQEYLKSLGVSEGTMGAYREVLLANADDNMIKSAFKDVKFRELDVKSIEKLNRINESVGGFYKELESITKKLEKDNGQAPKNYTVKLKELINKVKVPLSALDDVLHLREIESTSFDRVTKIMAGAISDGFNTVKGQYDSLKVSDKENSRIYDECIRELKSTFQEVSSAIK